jgi:sugar phosphate permease
MESTLRKRPFFYGWYIVGVMIVAMTLVYGIRTSFSAFFAPILDEFNWYRGSTAIMLSLNILVYGLSAPFAGSLVDRWRPRTVVTLGILILSLATVSCYFARELWHFYLLFGVIAPFGTALCGSPVLNPTIINWFGKRKGLAMGLGQIGGGLSFAYVMLIEAVISRWGWQVSFFVMAGLVIVVLLPLYFLFFYNRPEDRGMQAYGSEEVITGAAIKVASPPEADWTLKTALKTHNLWLLVFSDFCYWGIGNYLVLAHQIKYAEDAGYSSLLAASVFALFGICSIAGQLVASVSDSIGREKAVLVSVVLAIGGLVALMAVRDTSQPWLLYLYSISSGLATGLYSPTIVVGVADIYYGKSIGAISALILTGVGFGGAIGPWLGGYIYDVYESYNLAFIICIVAFVLAGVSFWFAAPRHADRIRARIPDLK